MAKVAKKKYREGLNRFADAGRAVLVGGSILLPAKRDAANARIAATVTLVSIKVAAEFLKKAVPEQRPNREDHKSFPSEHAAECVAAAMILQREYPGPIGSAASVLAATVSYSRIASKKHHPRDVLAGAILGAGAAWLSLRVRLTWKAGSSKAANAKRSSARHS